MTIRNRLKLIGLVPITLLILLSSYFLVTSYVNFEKANALKTTLINNAPLNRALVQIGQERGLTALFLGSDKEEFADALEKQREKLDNAFEDLKYEVIQEKPAYLPFLLEWMEEKSHVDQNSYQKLFANISNLDAAREKIDNEAVDFKSVFFNTYTDGYSTPILERVLILQNYSLDPQISSLIDILAYGEIRKGIHVVRFGRTYFFKRQGEEE